MITVPPILTANPVLTVVYISGVAATFQVWWGGRVRKWRVEGSRLKNHDSYQWNFAELRNAWIATILASFVVHIILVLFGAPITSHWLQTYSLACLISILTVFTPTYTLGIPSTGLDTQSLLNRLTWIRLFAELSARNPVERAITYPVIGTALGCWVGTFPIALDWDRPWQAWPLPTAFGAAFGYITGFICAVILNGLQAQNFKTA